MKVSLKFNLENNNCVFKKNKKWLSWNKEEHHGGAGIYQPFCQLNKTLVKINKILFPMHISDDGSDTQVVVGSVHT